MPGRRTNKHPNFLSLLMNTPYYTKKELKQLQAEQTRRIRDREKEMKLFPERFSEDGFYNDLGNKIHYPEIFNQEQKEKEKRKKKKKKRNFIQKDLTGLVSILMNIKERLDYQIVRQNLVYLFRT